MDPGRLQRSGGFRGAVLGRSWRSRGGTRASTKQFPARVQGDSRRRCSVAFPGCPGRGQAGVGRRGSNPSPPGGATSTAPSPLELLKQAPALGASPTRLFQALPGARPSPRASPLCPSVGCPPRISCQPGAAGAPSPAHAHSALRTPERQGPSEQPLPASRAGRAGWGGGQRRRRVPGTRLQQPFSGDRAEAASIVTIRGLCGREKTGGPSPA